MRSTTDAIVIGIMNIDESDRLLTLLSQEHGVIRAYARGAKKPGGRLCGGTELLCYSRFALFTHKGRCTVDSADSNNQFFGIRQDIEKLSLASYLCELCADTSPCSRAEAQLPLILNCMYFLESGKRSLAFIKAVYELRQISLSGYMPNLVACSVCGSFESERFHFYHQTGQLICSGCDSEPAPEKFSVLSPSVTAAMRHIIYSDAGKLFSFTLPEGSQTELSAVCERYVKNQLSRTFKSLDFYNMLFLTA